MAAALARSCYTQAEHSGIALLSVRRHQLLPLVQGGSIFCIRTRLDLEPQRLGSNTLTPIWLAPGWLMRRAGYLLASLAQTWTERFLEPLEPICVLLHTKVYNDPYLVRDNWPLPCIDLHLSHGSVMLRLARSHVAVTSLRSCGHLTVRLPRGAARLPAHVDAPPLLTRASFSSAARLAQDDLKPYYVTTPIFYVNAGSVLSATVGLPFV